jgi:hypothetical protein
MNAHHMLRRRARGGRPARWLAAILLVPISSLVAVVVMSSPALAATHLGNETCNWSSSEPTVYISVGCEIGHTQFGDFAYLTVPSTSGSIATASWYLKSFSGSPCTAFVYSGVAWSGTTGAYEKWIGYQNTSGVGSTYAEGSASAGSRFLVQNVYEGAAKYKVYIGTTSVTASGLGYGTCYTTEGEAIHVKNVGLTALTVGTSTFKTTTWFDTSDLAHTGFNSDYLSAPCSDGQTPPYCLNGTWYSSNTEWASNKPS